MKKRPYRATPVNKVDLEKLRSAVAGNDIVFAIDVAKSDMVATLMSPDRSVLTTMRWRHPAETATVIEVLRALSAGSIAVVMEPSGTYGDPLQHAFSQHWPVYMVSGKRTHDAAEVYDGVPSSHDGKSAYVIGRLHLEGASKRWTAESVSRRELRVAIGTMQRYQKQYLDGVNRLEATLARHWPELTTYLELTSRSIMALLDRFSGPEEVACRSQAAAELLRCTGRDLLTPEKIAGVLASASSSCGVPMCAGERDALRDLVRDMARAREEAREAKKRMELLVIDTPSVANTQSLLGITAAAVLFAELGDLTAYPKAGSLLKALGLNLRVRSSGQSKGQLHITKRGPSVCRKMLYFATLRLIKKDPWVRAWYLNKIERDGGQKMRAIIAVMRKLVRALPHVARGAPFDATKLFDTSRLESRRTKETLAPAA